MHTVSSLLLPPSTLRENLENIKRCMTQPPQLTLPNEPDKGKWSYYEELQMNLLVFDDIMSLFHECL